MCRDWTDRSIGGGEMEEIQKEIQSLKRKTLYLGISIIVLSMSAIVFTIDQHRRYEAIQDYYCESLEQDLNLIYEIKEQNLELEERQNEMEEIRSAQENLNEDLKQILSNLQ